MAIQQESAELAAVVEETVSGVRVVKGFGAEGVQAQRLRAEADDVYERSIDGRSRPGPLPAGPRAAAEHRAASPCSATAATRCSTASSPSASWSRSTSTWCCSSGRCGCSGMIVAQGQRAAAAAERVARGARHRAGDRRSPAAAQAADGERAAGALGEVRFEQCHFGYAAGGRSVLDGFDLAVAPGESVALVGATGSGKTTVARLLPRFYDVDAGRVLHRRRRRARRSGSTTCAARSASSSRTRSCSTTRSRANIAFADPDAAARPDRAGRPAGRRPRVHHATCPTATTPLIGERGLLAVGRPAPAHRHRPGDPRRPPRADPRRRHLVRSTRRRSTRSATRSPR